MNTVEVQVKRLDPTLPLPSYAHSGDAALDIYAAEDCAIEPGHRALISTGIALAIPEGYAGFVQPRSGLALRSGLSLVNTPGLIDSHYRGEVKIIAMNLDPSEAILISHGDRIAQLVVQRVERVTLREVVGLDTTARGEGGFGSSGIR